MMSHIKLDKMSQDVVFPLQKRPVVVEGHAMNKFVSIY